MTSAPLVLIVDDNEMNLKLTRDVLRAAGFRTLEGRTGAEGIALSKRHVPDLILMDLGLPDMDGSEAARAIRSRAATARVPVVALSAVRLGESHDWLDSTGFAGFIEKPIDVSQFPDQVRRYCGSG